MQKDMSKCADPVFAGDLALFLQDESREYSSSHNSALHLRHL